jgi:alkane 1-monooxygenase
MVFIVSNFYASQFSVSHELMHKPGKFFKVLGTLHMVKHYYMHFTYHHLFRHHYEVATPSDPSSAKKNETVYSFIVRCIVYSWKGVYDDERKLGKTFLANYAVLSILGSCAFMSCVYLAFGLQALILHSVMAFGSVVYLEAINYIEHYGL